MPTHWDNRDRKLKKRTQGMRVSNRGIFTVVETQRKRDNERKAREFLREKKGAEE